MKKKLMHNRIEEIDSEMFFRCTELTVLNLIYNRLANIDENLFERIGLFVLNLSNNKLFELELKTFKDQTFLEVLRLDNNELDLIKPGLFDMLESVKLISLFNNNVKFDSYFNDYYTSPSTSGVLLNNENIALTITLFNENKFSNLNNWKMFLKRLNDHYLKTI